MLVASALSPAAVPTVPLLHVTANAGVGVAIIEVAKRATAKAGINNDVVERRDFLLKRLRTVIILKLSN